MSLDTSRDLESPAQTGESSQNREPHPPGGWLDRLDPDELSAWSCESCEGTDARGEIVALDDGTIIVYCIVCGLTERYRPISSAEGE